MAGAGFEERSGSSVTLKSGAYPAVPTPRFCLPDFTTLRRGRGASLVEKPQ